MNLSCILISGRLLFLTASLVCLTQCGDGKDPAEIPAGKPAETESTTPTLSAAELDDAPAPPPAPKLEEIIRGVWQSTETEKLEAAPEKIQLDFRADGEFTMLIYQEGITPQEGRYEVKGDELWLRVQGQEEDSVETRFDGKTLTIIDSANDEEVTFEKL